MNLTCHSEDSIILKWKRPIEYYQTIDSYVVNYRIAGRERFREIELNASADVLETSVSVIVSIYTNLICYLVLFIHIRLVFGLELGGVSMSVSHR